MTPLLRELLDFIDAPHVRCCEVCEWLDDETCHRDLGNERRFGRPHAPAEDAWSIEETWSDWEEQVLRDARDDFEWRAYLTARYGEGDYRGPHFLKCGYVFT